MIVIILICLIPSKVFFNSHILDDKTVIFQETEKYKNKKLLRAVIKVESSYNKYAVSKKGAVGLMQIRPEIWHNELTKVGIISNYKDYFEIEKNIKAGNYILTKYHKNDLKITLKKYSGGAKNYYNKVIKEMKHGY